MNLSLVCQPLYLRILLLSLLTSVWWLLHGYFFFFRKLLSVFYCYSNTLNNKKKQGLHEQKNPTTLMYAPYTSLFTIHTSFYCAIKQEMIILSSCSVDTQKGETSSSSILVEVPDWFPMKAFSLRLALSMLSENRRQTLIGFTYSGSS